jgi:hypothetical protein
MKTNGRKMECESHTNGKRQCVKSTLLVLHVPLRFGADFIQLVFGIGEASSRKHRGIAARNMATKEATTRSKGGQ